MSTESELRAENERLAAANHRLSTHLISMSDTLQASAREIAAQAWDEGFAAGWSEATDPDAFVNDVWDAKTHNPHRQPKETLGDTE